MEIIGVNTVWGRRSAIGGLLLAVCAVSGFGRAASPSTPTPRLDAIIQEVAAKGPSSEIPPHLSVVLGISKTPQSTRVKQAVMRAGELMRTFNVRTEQRGDVVLMAYDTRTRATKAYLTNPAGTLRKAVSYQPGEAPAERTPNEAREEFAAEINFWLNLSKTGSPAPH